MTENNSKEVVVTREFNAPRELVWKAFTQSEALAQWWGPKGATIEVSKFEFRPGGMFLYSMEGAPNMPKMWGKFVYREIVPMEKIVFVNSFSDENGGTTPNPWMPKWPLEILNHLTMEEKDGKTTVTITGGPINTDEEGEKTFDGGKKGMEQGFAGTWEKLDEYLAKQSS